MTKTKEEEVSSIDVSSSVHSFLCCAGAFINCQPLPTNAKRFSAPISGSRSPRCLIVYNSSEKHVNTVNSDFVENPKRSAAVCGRSFDHQ